MKKVGRDDRAVLRKFASWNSPINIDQSGHFTLAKSLGKSGGVCLYATSWLSNTVPPPGLYHGKFATVMGKFMIDKKARNPVQMSPDLLRSKVVSRFELTKDDLEAYKLGEVSFYLTDSTTKECEYPSTFYLPEGSINTFDPEPEQDLDIHT